MLESLLVTLIVIAIVATVIFCVLNVIPMDPNVKRAVIVVVSLLLLLYLVQRFLPILGVHL